MSLYEEKENEELCIANFKTVARYATRFAQGQWSFLGLGSEKKCTGRTRTSRMENGMMLNLATDAILYSVDLALLKKEI